MLGKISRQTKVVLISSVFISFVTYFFGFANLIRSRDSFYVFSGREYDVIRSGRWLLAFLQEIIYKLGFHYNTHFLYSIISLLLIIISACIFVKVFNIQRDIDCVLISGFFVVFPAIASIFFYSYTAIYYAFAILMAVFAVYIADNHKYGIIFSGILGCLSMGIYQAYLPLMMGMFVTLLIMESLEDKGLKEVFLHALKYLASLIIMIAGYFVMMKFSLYITGETLTSYKGIDKAASIKPSELPSIVYQTYRQFFMIVKENYAGMSGMPIIRLLILLLGILSVILLIYLMIKKREYIFRKQKGIIFLFLLIYPLAVNFVKVMSHSSYIHTLMIDGLVLIFVMPILLINKVRETKPDKVISFSNKVVMILLCCTLFSFIYQDNWNYQKKVVVTEQAQSYLNSIITSVLQQKDFSTDKKWVIYGDLDDPLLINYWDADMNYIGNETLQKLISGYSQKQLIASLTGYDLPIATDEEIDKMKSDGVFEDMANYPNPESIKIYGSYIIVHLSDEDIL